MKSSKVLALCAAFLSVNSLATLPKPASAQIQPDVIVRANRSATVLTVQVPAMEINVESGKTVELAGQLISPVQLGAEMIPTGTIVKLAVIPTETGDAYLVADSLIVNGYTIPIEAESSPIPSEIITDRKATETAKEGAGIGSHTGERLALAFGGDAEDAIQVGSIVDLVGVGVGSLSAEKRAVVRLTQGVYFLNLKSRTNNRTDVSAKRLYLIRTSLSY